jgi:O-antigen/teichoic acid export membrane protein
MLRSLLKDMGSYLPSKIVPALIGLVSVPVITRLFPPADYGHYMIVIATASVFTNTLSWIPVSIIRFYHQYRNAGKEATFYSTVLKLSLLTAAALAALFFGIVTLGRPFFNPGLYPLMRVGVLVFLALCSYNILENFLKARRLALWYSAFIVWQRAGAFLLGVGLVLFFNFGVEGLLWGLVLTIALAFPLLFKISVAVPPWREKGIDRPLTREMASYGFPMVAGILAAWILSLSDRYVLEFLAGSEAVGIYAANYNVAEKITLLAVNLFLTAGTPLAMSIWENHGGEECRRFLNQLSRAFLILVVPAVAGLAAVSASLVSLFLDSAYHEGYLVVPFVAVGVLFLGLEQILQSGLMFYKKTRLIMAAALISCIFNLTANIVFIPTYGYMAAAVTTLLSYLIYALLIFFFARRYFAWPFPTATLARVLGASALMVVVVLYMLKTLPLALPLTLALAVGTGAVLYFFVLYLCGEVNRAEIKKMLALRQKARG